jgi:hypothetical protein
LTAKAPSKTKPSKAEKQQHYGIHQKSVKGKELNHQTKDFPLKASNNSIIQIAYCNSKAIQLPSHQVSAKGERLEIDRHEPKS